MMTSFAFKEASGINSRRRASPPAIDRESLKDGVFWKVIVIVWASLFLEGYGSGALDITVISAVSRGNSCRRSFSLRMPGTWDSR